ncbi:MAG: hypothetical protein NC247_00105 [Ruminococcus flavefaciens]|nr:hypothetical protein [Ruminococcus flavefaciens]MCM1361438.1 hypothetical protein [Clostridiales bacterium]MCM1435907.1 hypothetical protein [Ruminococcus flavefaciens]
MSFAIISERNNGYPCIPELDEFVSAERKPPYSDFMLLVEENNYPMIKKLALKKTSAERTVPYPDFIMRCYPELNDGYPYLLKLGALTEDVQSSLFAGEKKVINILAGDREIKSAYCRGEAVFVKCYVKRNI